MSGSDQLMWWSLILCLGGAAFHPLLWVRLLFPSLLLGGAAFRPLLWVELLFSFSLLGGAAWPPPPLGGVGFAPLLWVALFFPPFPSWWCCSTSFLGSWCFLPCPLGWCFFFFCEPAPPKGRRGRQHDRQKERPSSPQHHPEGEGELNWTELNLSSFDKTHFYVIFERKSLI